MKKSLFLFVVALMVFVVPTLADYTTFEMPDDDTESSATNANGYRFDVGIDVTLGNVTLYPDDGSDFAWLHNYNNGTPIQIANASIVGEIANFSESLSGGNIYLITVGNTFYGSRTLKYRNINLYPLLDPTNEWVNFTYRASEHSSHTWSFTQDYHASIKSIKMELPDTISIDLIETYNEVVNEGSTQHFGLKITEVTSDINMALFDTTFYYNGKNYTPTNTYNDSTIIFNVSLNPYITNNDATQNFSFHWDYSAPVSSSAINLDNSTTIKDQTVHRSILSECGSGNKVLELIVLDEADLTNITNNDVVVNFEIWANNASNHVNQSFSLSGSHNYSLCMSNLSGTYHTDATLGYTGPGYVSRSYYLIDYVLNATSKNVELPLLSITNSSNIFINVKDQNDYAMQNLYVKALRYYPGTNTYKLVEISKTDYNGDTVQKLVPYNVFYRFILERDGVIFNTVGPALVTLESMDFRVNTEESTYTSFDKVRGLQNTLTFNNVSGTFSFSWVDTSNFVREGCLKVYSMKPNGGSFLGQNCEESAAGAVNYVVGTNLTGTYLAEGYIVSDSKYSTWKVNEVEVNFGTVFELFGDIGLFISFIIILSFALIGFATSSVLLFALYGIIVVSLAGFFSGTLTVIVVLGMVIIFMIYKMKS